MLLTKTEQWSSDKAMMRPTRSEANIDSFSETGKICKKRALLECERIFFKIKTEKTFAENNSEFSMNLLDRERAMLVIDKRVCWSRCSFYNVMQCNECKTELKRYCIKYHVQTKACDRDKQCKTEFRTYKY